VRPVMRVKRDPLEISHAVDFRQRRRLERTEGSHDDTRGQRAAVAKR
jgi:hypothetical protein